MDKVLENILTRRSTRSFKDKPIPKEDLEEIMKAAIYAPTAMNKQAWEFLVINNREKIQELAGLMGKFLNNPDYNMYSPQVLVIPSIPPDIVYGIDDCACALENIFLAAHSLGVGSCWINQMRTIIDNKELRDYLTELGIPEGNTVYGMAALGYPADTEFKPLERTGKVTYID